MDNFIPVNIPLLDGNEKKYLIDCVESGWISSEGPYVERLEAGMASQVGRKYSVAVSNGSVAIDCAIAALGIGKGDEVILPTFTIISCVSQILRVGAVPVFIDMDSATFNMKPDEIESKITSRTRAIMLVHIYGLPVDLHPILKLAEKYKLKVIEDAAEVHGQSYRGNACGSFGDISVFSFYPNKHVTTGERGMILTDDVNIYNRCRELRNLCFKPDIRFVHDSLGWNFRMTNMQAAIGVAQLERLSLFVKLKRKMGQIYNELLDDCSHLISLPIRETEYAENIYWVYTVVLKDDVAKNTNAREIMSLLSQRGIGTRPFFFPLHLQPIVNEYFPESEKLTLNNSKFAWENGFYLPSGLGNTESDFIRSAKELKSILRQI